jgi:hypothetical protein
MRPESSSPGGRKNRQRSMARNGVHRAKPTYPSVARTDHFRQRSALPSPARLCPPIWRRRAVNVLPPDRFHSCGPELDRLTPPFSDGGDHMDWWMPMSSRPVPRGADGELLINHWFNDDSHHPSMLQLEHIGRTRREIDYASADVWAAVIDFDDDRAAIVEIRHLRVGGERK